MRTTRRSSRGASPNTATEGNVSTHDGDAMVLDSSEHNSQVDAPVATSAIKMEDDSITKDVSDVNVPKMTAGGGVAEEKKPQGRGPKKAKGGSTKSPVSNTTTTTTIQSSSSIATSDTGASTAGGKKGVSIGGKKGVSIGGKKGVSIESSQTVVGGLPSALKQSGSEKKAKKESVQFDISEEIPAKPRPKRKRKEKGDKDARKKKVKKVGKREKKAKKRSSKKMKIEGEGEASSKSYATLDDQDEAGKSRKRHKNDATKATEAGIPEKIAKKDKKDTKDKKDKKKGDKDKKKKDKKSERMDIQDEKAKIAEKRKKKRKRNKDKKKEKTSKRLRVETGMGLIEACLTFRRKSDKKDETSSSSPTSASEQSKARLPEPHELDQYNYRHYQSRPLDYKITVPMPPMWKLKCIAQLKKREYLKNKAVNDAKKGKPKVQGDDNTSSAMQNRSNTTDVKFSSSDPLQMIESSTTKLMEKMPAEKEEVKMDIASETEDDIQENSIAPVDEIPPPGSSGSNVGGETSESKKGKSKSTSKMKKSKRKVKDSIKDKDKRDKNPKKKKKKKKKKKLSRKLLSKSPLTSPLMGLQVANKPLLAQYTDQDLLAELGEMNRNCTILKTEMSALEGFRNNVVWLMDQATKLQTQRNHNIDDFDASFPVVNSNKNDSSSAGNK